MYGVLMVSSDALVECCEEMAERSHNFVEPAALERFRCVFLSDGWNLSGMKYGCRLTGSQWWKQVLLTLPNTLLDV
jgi:hypothetical protein